MQSHNANSAEQDSRWQAVINKDKAADGKFFYCVKTTGIYCRPSCGAKSPKSTNVQFHLSCSDAEKAGFRPCKRCKPEQLPLAEQQTQKIAHICRYIESCNTIPHLKDLAEQADMSPYNFHRLFKSITGLTPKAYASADRIQRLKNGLTEAASVTEAILEAGFNSSSRFYEKSNQALGMSPTAFRTGGTGMTIYFAVGECTLGSILIACSNKGICAILLGDDPVELSHNLQDRFPRATLIGADKEFERIVATVVGFVDAPAIGLNLPLDIRGTAFQQRVWQALTRIPLGSTASYTEIALQIGAPKSARAVALACGANALAVAIPCHRVVRTDGAISGYRWGIERKRKLLAREAGHCHGTI